jgi:hypothetical protein
MDNPIIQAFVQAWPTMIAQPGITLALLGIGTVVGFVFKAILAKAKIDGLEAEVRSKDDRLEGARERQEDIKLKYSDLISQLSVANSTIIQLTSQVRQQASPLQIATTTASMAENLASVTAASGSLGKTISTGDMYTGLRTYLGQLAPLSTSSTSSTSSPVSSHPSPEPPALPAKK